MLSVQYVFVILIIVSAGGVIYRTFSSSGKFIGHGLRIETGTERIPIIPKVPFFTTPITVALFHRSFFSCKDKAYAECMCEINQSVLFFLCCLCSSDQDTSG